MKAFWRLGEYSEFMAAWNFNLVSAYHGANWCVCNRRGLLTSDYQAGYTAYYTPRITLIAALSSERLPK